MITLLNTIRIIYSFFLVKKYDKSLDSDIIERIIEDRPIDISTYEMCVWINYLKLTNRGITWSKSQMLRELIYHKRLYKIKGINNLWLDFSNKQSFKDKIKRIFGNLLV